MNQQKSIFRVYTTHMMWMTISKKVWRASWIWTLDFPFVKNQTLFHLTWVDKSDSEEGVIFNPVSASLNCWCEYLMIDDVCMFVSVSQTSCQSSCTPCLQRPIKVYDTWERPMFCLCIDSSTGQLFQVCFGLINLIFISKVAKCSSNLLNHFCTPT